jgi:hypothetical protein
MIPHKVSDRRLDDVAHLLGPVAAEVERWIEFDVDREFSLGRQEIFPNNYGTATR